MLKLNAAYSKKVPAESQYSSQSYHCSIESELPDGLTPQQLQERIHNAFDFVRNSVEAEIHNSAQTQQMPQQMQQQQMQQTNTMTPPQVQPVQQYYDPQADAQMQPQLPSQPMQQQPPQNGRQYNRNAIASSKQINYLLSLVKRAGWTVQQLLQKCQVASVDQIPSKMCSQLIQQFSGQAA